jgi:hypothetical protein
LLSCPFTTDFGSLFCLRSIFHAHISCVKILWSAPGARPRVSSPYPGRRLLRQLKASVSASEASPVPFILASSLNFSVSFLAAQH